jgi:AcrR family transcriptional regulator
MSMPMPKEPKRTYDATRRRERAEEERGATRARVLEAAYELFVAHGYTETTIADIAREAGVAVQSVYKAGTSKAELLHAVVDRSVAGDDDDVLIADRPPFRAIAEESDPPQQVRMLADLICATQERSAPIQGAYRQAAAVDPTIASYLDAALRRRLETFTVVMEMIPAKHRRHPVPESAETAWAIGSSEVFLLLRKQQGWDADRFRRWLRATLVDVLLVPES